MQSSKELLKTIQKIDEAAKDAYLLGKGGIDIGPLMARLQMESFANIARIRELLEKKFGEESLDGIIELRGDLVSTEREEKDN